MIRTQISRRSSVMADRAAGCRGVTQSALPFHAMEQTLLQIRPDKRICTRRPLEPVKSHQSHDYFQVFSSSSSSFLVSVQAEHRQEAPQAHTLSSPLFFRKLPVARRCDFI